MARVTASAPGKLVVLGEYAVLANAPALVMAVDRRCRAKIESDAGAACRMRSRAGEERECIFRPGAASGVALVDRVVRELPAEPVGDHGSRAGPAKGRELAAGFEAGRASPAGSVGRRQRPSEPAGKRHFPPEPAGGPTPPARPDASWRGVLDSGGLFRSGRKLGLGSSAAALTAWTGAWLAWSGRKPAAQDAETLDELIRLHRACQGGVGSGIDVAASLYGGVNRFQAGDDSPPRVESAKLPAGVGFVAVFTGFPTSTARHVARFHARLAESPAAADFWVNALARSAETGLACAAADDAQGFLAAIRDYAGGLQALGEWMGAEIFSPEHLDVLEMAVRHGVAYKVSGAGGGDLGLGFSADPEALARFGQAVEKRYDTIRLAVDPVGLSVEIAER